VGVILRLYIGFWRVLGKACESPGRPLERGLGGPMEKVPLRGLKGG